MSYQHTKIGSTLYSEHHEIKDILYCIFNPKFTNSTLERLRKPWIHVQTGPQRLTVQWPYNKPHYVIATPTAVSSISHTRTADFPHVCYSSTEDTSFVSVSANLMLRLTSATINKARTESIGVLHRCLFLNHDVSIKSSANQRGSKENKPL